MFGLFKQKTNGELADEAQKDQSLDRIVAGVERQRDELLRDLRRARERRMLREALGGNGDN